MTKSALEVIRRLGGPASLVVAAAALGGCSDVTGAGPERGRLSGVYSMSDMLFVFLQDTFAVTGGSFLQFEFIDDEHVRGSGEIWLEVPVRNEQGEIVPDSQPFLRAWTDSGPGPATFEGWYYIDESPRGDTLRFRFAEQAGAGSIVEALDWVLDENWASYRGDLELWPYRIGITQSAR